jgi:hypothetical protein
VAVDTAGLRYALSDRKGVIVPAGVFYSPERLMGSNAALPVPFLYFLCCELSMAGKYHMVFFDVLSNVNTTVDISGPL